MYEVQQILGHSDPKVTMRYAHLSTQALLAAADSASVVIKGVQQREQQRDQQREQQRQEQQQDVQEGDAGQAVDAEQAVDETVGT